MATLKINYFYEFEKNIKKNLWKIEYEEPKHMHQISFIWLYVLSWILWKKIFVWPLFEQHIFAKNIKFKFNCTFTNKTFKRFHTIKQQQKNRRIELKIKLKRNALCKYWIAQYCAHTLCVFKDRVGSPNFFFLYVRK